MSRFQNALRVWHASPHDFSELRPMREVFGKGQGAAMYGAGLYVAESEKVSGPGESHYMQEFERTHGSAPDERLMGLDPHKVDLLSFTPELVSQHFGPANVDLARKSLEETFAGLPVETDAALAVLARKSPDVIASYLRGLLGEYKYLRSEDPHIFKTGGFLEFLDDKVSWLPDIATELDLDRPEDLESVQLEHDLTKAIYTIMNTGAGGDHQLISSPGKGGPTSYEMMLNLQPHEILHWDRPLSTHHPDLLPKFHQIYDEKFGIGLTYLRQGKDGRRYYQNDMDTLSGEDLYNDLVRNYIKIYKGADAKLRASEYLMSHGIKAIKYRDHDSRLMDNLLLYNGRNSNDFYESHHTPRDDPESKLSKREHEVLRYLGGLVGSMHLSSIPELEEFIDERLKLDGRLLNDAQYKVYKEAKKILENRRQFMEVKEPEGRTHNYVIFDHQVPQIVAKYDIRGNKIEDFGGKALILKPVEGDPFKDPPP